MEGGLDPALPLGARKEGGPLPLGARKEEGPAPLGARQEEAPAPLGGPLPLGARKEKTPAGGLVMAWHTIWRGTRLALLFRGRSLSTFGPGRPFA